MGTLTTVRDVGSLLMLCFLLIVTVGLPRTITTTTGAAACSLPPAMQKTETHKQHNEQNQWRNKVFHNIYSNPAKPMNAMDSVPAIISTKPVP
jgi:hypothetical protein